MQKIISLFQRNYETDRLVRDEVVPGAEWVLAGEGLATRKWDGTACLVRGDKLLKRYSVKRGRTAPPDFVAASEVNPKTGKQEGWVPVSTSCEDEWHREAFNREIDAEGNAFKDGTYELCGPKVEGNPEGAMLHMLIPHGRDPLDDAPRDFVGLQQYFLNHNIEGIVWHHDDGRMVKIKGKDFGITRAAGADGQ